MGALKKDPFEVLAVEGELRLYSIVAAVIVSCAYGNSTPKTLDMFGLASNDLVFVKIVALALIAAGLGSALVNSAALAPPRRRSSFVWGVRGLLGGPLAVIQLCELDVLKTNEESEGQ
jgi:hypothetical protein